MVSSVEVDWSGIGGSRTQVSIPRVPGETPWSGNSPNTPMKLARSVSRPGNPSDTVSAPTINMQSRHIPTRIQRYRREIAIAQIATRAAMFHYASPHSIAFASKTELCSSWRPLDNPIKHLLGQNSNDDKPCWVGIRSRTLCVVSSGMGVCMPGLCYGKVLEAARWILLELGRRSGGPAECQQLSANFTVRTSEVLRSLANP